MFNNEVREWMKYDAFRISGINFSIRLIKKFVDSQRIFGDDWREFNTTYLQLKAAKELSEARSEEAVTAAQDTLNGIVGTAPTTTALPPMDVNGLYINSHTGQPYSPARQSYYKQLAKATVA